MPNKGSFATTSAGLPLNFDPTTLVQRHLLVVGQTGSGKTTTTLSLLDQLQHANYTTIILDPTGEYAKLPNAVTYCLGQNAYLEAGQLTAAQLRSVLQLAELSPLLADQLSQAVDALRIQQNIVQVDHPYVKLNVPITAYQSQLAKLGEWSKSFAPQLLGQQLLEELIVPYADERADYTLLGQQYDRPRINQEWSALATIRQRFASETFKVLFDPEPHPGVFKTELNFVLKMFLSHQTSHRTLVIDLSALKEYELSQRVVISLLLKNLLAYRLAHPQPFPVNLVIDEAHRYLPTQTAALPDNGIFQVLREGRKVNLSLTLTTQSPLDLPARLRSQFANVLVHHLAAPEEVSALGQAHSLSMAQLATLQTGQALLCRPGHEEQKLLVQLPKWWTN